MTHPGRSIPLLLLLAACAATGPGQETYATAGPVQRAALYVGQRSLDEGDWEPVEDQATLGLEYSRENPASLVGWELGLLASQDDADERFGGIDFDFEGSTTELYGGVRKTFGDEEARVHPYVGGGLSLVNAKVEVKALGESEDEDDDSIAGYLHGGIAFDLTESFYAGVDLRILVGSDIEIAGVDADADYEQLALVIGFSF